MKLEALPNNFLFTRFEIFGSPKTGTFHSMTRCLLEPTL